MGDLDSIKKDFDERVTALVPSHESIEAARAAAAQQLYALAWGPTRVPIYDLVLLSTLIVPPLRKQHVDLARWLAQEAKVPVDGMDASGTTALSHAISTKPAFDPEFAQILYDAGADVNHKNRYGGTCAHEIAIVWELHNRVALQRAADALEWFMAHGGNADVKDNDGMAARRAIESSSRTGKLPPHYVVMKKEDERRKKLRDELCAFCGRTPVAPQKLLFCSRCRATKYCGPPRTCQKVDWSRHKPGCRMPTPPGGAQ